MRTPDREVLPEITNRLAALFIRRTDGEAPFHLACEPLGGPACSRADDQKIIRLPAEMLGLEAHLAQRGVDEEGLNCSDQELR